MKKRIGVIFGGKSTEHEVSIESAKTLLVKLDASGYDAVPVYITKSGGWRLPGKSDFIDKGILTGPVIEPSFEKKDFVLRGRALGLAAVFPIVHGSTGEDGVLQGFLELLGLPYAGSGVLASALCMDKILAKKIARDCGLPVLPHILVNRNDPAKINKAVKEAYALGFPLFVKPVSLGSSVGVVKVKRKEELKKAILFAFRFDSKVMIEKGVDHAREIVCGVLGNEEAARSSVCGEIRPKGKHEFFDYDAKYLDENGMDFTLPAPLSEASSDKIRIMSETIFQESGCSGLARVDFFVDPKNEKNIWFCEINTLPGFTSHSLYPTLWANSGINTGKLVARLMRLAFTSFTLKSKLQTKRK